MKIKHFLCLLALGFAVESCDLINPAEPIPAYLHIRPFSFSTNASQGSSSSKITDGWVYVGGDFLGAYTLPATMPVIATGEQEVQVFPGIKDNGIAALPDIYPLYERYIVAVDLSENVEDTIRPVTHYVDNVRFALLEGFENNLHTFSEDLDDNQLTTLETSSQKVFEGSQSGRIFLDQENALFTAGSDRLNVFPPGGTPVYVEMNYQTEVPLSVGLYGYDNVGVRTFQLINRGANANEEWNKIYFNFTEEMRTLSNSNIAEYQVVLQAVIPLDEGGFTLEEANIYVDNVKLVMFE